MWRKKWIVLYPCSVSDHKHLIHKWRVSQHIIIICCILQQRGLLWWKLCAWDLDAESCDHRKTKNYIWTKFNMQIFSLFLSLYFQFDTFWSYTYHNWRSVIWARVWMMICKKSEKQCWEVEWTATHTLQKWIGAFTPEKETETKKKRKQNGWLAGERMACTRVRC